jgi:hypothetical protein
MESRRYAGRAYYGARAKTERRPHIEKRPYIETVVAQLVVCSITLAVMMLFTVVDIPVSRQAKESFVSAIKNDEGVYTFAKITDSIDGVKSSMRGMFGETGALAENKGGGDLTGDALAEIGLVEEGIATDGGAAQIEADRIDEDILNELNERSDYYGDSAKKQTVLLREELEKTALTAEPRQ